MESLLLVRASPPGRGSTATGVEDRRHGVQDRPPPGRTSSAPRSNIERRPVEGRPLPGRGSTAAESNLERRRVEERPPWGRRSTASMSPSSTIGPVAKNRLDFQGEREATRVKNTEWSVANAEEKPKEAVKEARSRRYERARGSPTRARRLRASAVRQEGGDRHGGTPRRDAHALTEEAHTDDARTYDALPTVAVARRDGVSAIGGAPRTRARGADRTRVGDPRGRAPSGRRACGRDSGS